jgi:hypothetical protein
MKEENGNKKLKMRYKGGSHKSEENEAEKFEEVRS